MLFRSKEILGSVPPMPKYYPRMKVLNARGAETLAMLPGATPIPPAQLEELRNEADVVVLDLRGPEAFGVGHIPGSVNIGAGPSLSLWSGWLLDAKSRIVMVNDQGDDEESRRALVRVGLDHIAGYLAGGILAWIDAGLNLSRIPQLSIAEVQDREADAMVVDVRSDAEWTSGHIAKARHMMLGDLRQELSEVPRETLIITVCGSGYRSYIAASLLVREGYRNVSSMDGGMGAWNREGFPVAGL